jgi:hypothetical protein
VGSNKITALVRRWEGDENIREATSHAPKRPRRSTHTSETSPIEAEKPAQDDDENDEDDGFLAIDSGAPIKNDDNESNDEDEEKASLRKELEEARATIARWEKINNKLAKKLAGN